MGGHSTEEIRVREDLQGCSTKKTMIWEDIQDIHKSLQWRRREVVGKFVIVERRKL